MLAPKALQSSVTVSIEYIIKWWKFYHYLQSAWNSINHLSSLVVIHCTHFKMLSLVFLTLFEILGSYTYNCKKTLQIYNFLLGKDNIFTTKYFKVICLKSQNIIFKIINK